MSTRSSITREVVAEEERQDRLWGDQSAMANGTGPAITPLRGWHEVIKPPTPHFPEALHFASFAQLAAFARYQTKEAADDNRCTWQRVALEEVLEAMAESEPALLREELVQAAAVLQQWVAAIDTKAGVFKRPREPRVQPAHVRALYLFAEHPEGLTHGKLHLLWQAKASRRDPWPYISESGARTRVSELKRWGIIEDSGRAGRTPSNRPTAVWQLADDTGWHPPQLPADAEHTRQELLTEAGTNVILRSILEAVVVERRAS